MSSLSLEWRFFRHQRLTVREVQVPASTAFDATALSISNAAPFGISALLSEKSIYQSIKLLIELKQAVLSRAERAVSPACHFSRYSRLIQRKIAVLSRAERAVAEEEFLKIHHAVYEKSIRTPSQSSRIHPIQSVEKTGMAEQARAADAASRRARSPLFHVLSCAQGVPDLRWRRG